MIQLVCFLGPSHTRRPSTTTKLLESHHARTHGHLNTDVKLRFHTSVFTTHTTPTADASLATVPQDCTSTTTPMNLVFSLELSMCSSFCGCCGCSGSEINDRIVLKYPACLSNIKFCQRLMRPRVTVKDGQPLATFMRCIHDEPGQRPSC